MTLVAREGQDGVTTTLTGVQSLEIHPLGGADSIDISTQTDIASPTLNNILVDLEGVLHIGVGDGMIDTIIVQGDNHVSVGDFISIQETSAGLTVFGVNAPEQSFMRTPPTALWCMAWAPAT